MKKWMAIVFLLISSNGFSQNERYTMDTLLLKSEILNENRSLIIYKPLNYSEIDSFTFVYLIDGENSKYRIQQLYEYFKDGLSDVIAIGIVNTDRKRDLLYINEADPFLSFITSEVIPLAENGYHAKSRILYGHSFGGGFTVYAMLNKPNNFDCFIASSPTPIMALIERDDYLGMDSQLNNKTYFYYSCGSKDIGQVRKWTIKLKANLDGIMFLNFVPEFSIFDGLNHNNSDIKALINALEKQLH